MRKFQITVNGNTYEVEVEEIGAGAPSAPVSAPAPAAKPAATAPAAPTASCVYPIIFHLSPHTVSLMHSYPSMPRTAR